MNPPWDSKYTININTEMNYWPAEPATLAECIEPLIAMVMELIRDRAAARPKCNGARAAGSAITTPTFGGRPRRSTARPGASGRRAARGFANISGTVTISAATRQYLAKVYPVMKGAAQFFLDTLVEEPKHKWLVTCPSLSPENTHPGGRASAPGPRWTWRSSATCSITASRQRRFSASTRNSAASSPRPARGWRRSRSAAPASFRNGWKTGT